jgi:hypothetical protein
MGLRGRNIFMEQFTTSVWRSIAGLRWPNFRVEGSGPIAIVKPCAATVVLVDIPLQVSAHKSCPLCGYHKGYGLERNSRPTFRRNASLAAMRESA